jgi:hypothetical protein
MIQHDSQVLDPYCLDSIRPHDNELLQVRRHVGCSNTSLLLSLLGPSSSLTINKLISR